MSLPARSIRLLLAGVVALALVLAGVAGGTAAAANGVLSRSLVDEVSGAPTRWVPVVVQANSTDGAAYAVRLAGGTVRNRVPLVKGVIATVRASYLPLLARLPGVRSVTPDAGLRQASDLDVPIPDAPPAPSALIDPVLSEPLVEARPEPLVTDEEATEVDPAGGAAAEPAQDETAQAAGDEAAAEPSGDEGAQTAGEEPASEPAEEPQPAQPTGEGAPTIAVVDSGVADHPDLEGRVTHVAVTSGTGDPFGHGTHVAGIVAADGPHPGVAPRARIVDVRVTDGYGRTSTGAVLRGLQWIADNAKEHGIRVVNMSLSSAVGQSARIDPIAAAVDALWARGIVVVAAAGNHGSNPNAVDFAPANAPRVITVGAASDWAPASFSSTGVTVDGRPKPELHAPGVGILSLLAGPDARLAVSHPEAVEEGAYFRMSGSSMAAPMVAGAAALLLEARPSLTPDQVKAALVGTARPFATGAPGVRVDLKRALAVDDPAGENPGLDAALDHVTQTVLPVRDWYAAWYAEWLGFPLTTATWTSATWTSATWTSATWTSATWTSATWTS